MNADPENSRRKRWSESRRRLTNWLTPGLGVKRWFLLIFMGITLLSVGLGIFLLDLYRNAPETWWLPVISTISLRFLPRILRVIVFGGLGVGLIWIGFWELNRSIFSPFIRPGGELADTLRQHRKRERGPRIVTIGGGHGLATLLRGLKEYSNNMTAIVTVADDGGSSGRLRRGMGILPPGDIRNCLAALSNDEALITQLFQYRFPDGDAAWKAIPSETCLSLPWQRSPGASKRRWQNRAVFWLCMARFYLRRCMMCACSPMCVCRT